MLYQLSYWPPTSRIVANGLTKSKIFARIRHPVRSVPEPLEDPLFFTRYVFPSAVWLAAVANLYLLAWNEDGVAFYVAFLLVTVLAALLVLSFRKVVGALEAPLPSWMRAAFYVPLLGALLAANWEMVPPAPWHKPRPPVPIEDLTPPSVDLDGVRLYVPPTPPRSPDLPDDLVGAIERGYEMAETARFDDVVARCQQAGKGLERCLGSYLLIAVNAQGTLQLVEVHKTADGKGTVSYPKGFTAARESGSGVNVSFDVSSPPGWTVVALRRPRKSGDVVVADTYIPYNPKFNTRELVAEGIEYLRLQLISAKYDLVARRVKSRFADGALVTDVGTLEHVATLLATEWVYDPARFVDGGDDEIRVEYVNRTLVMLGLNRSLAFRFGRSSASAVGILQIIPSTYAGLSAAYPTAELPSSATEGRLNHHVAIMTAILHADEELRPMNASQRAMVRRGEPAGGLLLAAGYNMFVDRAVGVVNARGEDWRNPCVDPCKDLPQLPAETRLYLKKYEWIHALLFTLEGRKKASEAFRTE